MGNSRNHGVRCCWVNGSSCTSRGDLGGSRSHGNISVSGDSERCACLGYVGCGKPVRDFHELADGGGNANICILVGRRSNGQLCGIAQCRGLSACSSVECSRSDSLGDHHAHGLGFASRSYLVCGCAIANVSSGDVCCC